MKEIIIGVVAAVLLPAVGYMLSKGAAVLNEVFKKKRAEALAADKNALAAAFQVASVIVSSVTRTTVTKIESTTAAGLREKVKNGEALYSELTILASDAYYEVLEQLQPEIRTTMEACVKDMESYIKNEIEGVLPAVKAEYAKSRAIGDMSADILRSRSDGANAEKKTE